MNRMKLTSLGQAPACASTRCRSASCTPVSSLHPVEVQSRVQCGALRRRSDPQIRDGRTRLIKKQRTSIELMYVPPFDRLAGSTPRYRSNRSLKLPTPPYEPIRSIVRTRVPRPR